MRDVGAHAGRSCSSTARSGDDCHSHTVQNFNGVASGSFDAPDHEYPSYLDLISHRDRLRRPDGHGDASARPEDRRPDVPELPTGLQLTVGSSSSTTPFTRTVIEGSTNSDQRALSPNARRHDLQLRLLVRRRSRGAQHRRQRDRDVHRDLSGRGQRRPPDRQDGIQERLDRDVDPRRHEPRPLAGAERRRHRHAALAPRIRLCVCRLHAMHLPPAS